MGGMKKTHDWSGYWMSRVCRLIFFHIISIIFQIISFQAPAGHMESTARR